MKKLLIAAAVSTAVAGSVFAGTENTMRRIDTEPNSNISVMVSFGGSTAYVYAVDGDDPRAETVVTENVASRGVTLRHTVFYNSDARTIKTPAQVIAFLAELGLDDGDVYVAKTGERNGRCGAVNPDPDSANTESQCFEDDGIAGSLTLPGNVIEGKPFF